MKSWILTVAVAAFASNALATPPDGPTITVAATDIKELQFDITPVTRVEKHSSLPDGDCPCADPKQHETDYDGTHYERIHTPSNRK